MYEQLRDVITALEEMRAELTARNSNKFTAAAKTALIEATKSVCAAYTALLDEDEDACPPK